ncbi:MAG TPA: type II secretion system protein GspG [Acidobacteriota bacterium]|nr:type II secretion system protein GspG [Acidobacteriota bacterium]
MRRYLLSLLLLLPVLTAGCGKNMNRQIREAVAKFDNMDLSEKDVKVLSVQKMGNQAVAEVEIKTAVKVSKQKDRWVIDEVRIGDRRWEKADHIRAALREQRFETTRKDLRTLAEGIRLWADRQGTLPPANDFPQLVDILSPEYLPRVIALDAWSNPYVYRSPAPQWAEVRSAGPDGKIDTPDDLTERVDR